MKFNKLTIENYKSFQFPTAINFPQSSEGKSIFLMGGMNGAGKTSVMEAINICLYGAKPENIYKTINRKELSKGNAFVSIELEMETDDFKTIMVHRSWSAGATDSPKLACRIKKCGKIISMPLYRKVLHNSSSLMGRKSKKLHPMTIQKFAYSHH
jgi:DNA sulfur modification protein DndD